ncbi:MAG: hypothetical protein JXB60_08780 [Candidatus Cloacimonetes bacterium]|nr:hypothetical protein [Candidatus Cloacimonadota bacterium]
MKIEHYTFGNIVINGRNYATDIIVYPDRVEPSWWRKSSHRVQKDDLSFLEEEKAEVVLFGTGYFGSMKVQEEVLKELESRKIEVIALKTEEAIKFYNRFSDDRIIIAAFHLTC